MHKLLLLTAFISAFLIQTAGCDRQVEAPTLPTETPTRAIANNDVNVEGRRVETVAENLQVPWGLAFAPDGRLFFTERVGRLRVIDSVGLVNEQVATFEVASVGEAGLLGLALDPEFASNGYLYVYYSYWTGPGVISNKVARLEMVEGRALNPFVLIDGIPGAFIHDGGRIKFGPDGKLYITTGDAADGQRAQDPQSLAGKILRINSDGSIPEDNPFPGSPIYSLGHRNPQGLAWQPGTRVLFATEHGPVGNDEVNVIVKGDNYGWPEVQGEQQSREFHSPILVFNRAVAPSGADFFTGQGSWNGNLFFATLRGETLYRLALGGANRQSVVDQERLFADEYGRLRDVVMGPDGWLYFCTNNRDGRGSPAANDDRILRVR